MRMLALMAAIVLAGFMLPVSDAQAQVDGCSGFGVGGVTTVAAPLVDVYVAPRAYRRPAYRRAVPMYRRFAAPVAPVQPVEVWVAHGRGPLGIFPRTWRFYRAR
jgi:hypothetical protein